MTATREAVFAKIVAQDAVLAKKTNGIQDRNVYGSMTVVRDADRCEKEAGMWDQDPHPDPLPQEM